MAYERGRCVLVSKSLVVVVTEKGSPVMLLRDHFMDGCQKIHLPVIALVVGSLHGIRGEFELSYGFGVEYC